MDVRSPTWSWPSARLTRFLAETATADAGRHPTSAIQRARLLERAAAALQADRAWLWARTHEGAYQGWAATGLTRAGTRSFLASVSSEDDLIKMVATKLRSTVTGRAAPGVGEVGSEAPASPMLRHHLAVGTDRGSRRGHLILEWEQHRPPPDSAEEQMLTALVVDRLDREISAGRSPSRSKGRPSAAATGRERRLLRGLLEAGTSMHQALGLDEILQRIAGILAEAGGFEAVAIYILDAPSQLLRPTAIVGVTAGEAARMRSLPVALADYAPLMRPAMRVGRSYLFDHRRHQLPENSILDTALSVPALPRDWRSGQWHPLDSLTIPMELGQGQLLGLISLDRPRNRRYPARANVRALELFADQCAAAISRAQLFQYMEELALTDSLTGLHNRHALERTLAQDLARVARSYSPYSVLFCDLDNFKTINDSLGHAVGDQILQQVAAILRQRLRRGDFAARCGGDEFVVLLPDTATEQAAAVADDIRRRIASDSATSGITVSIGVASPEAGALDPKPLLDAADAAMYAAKRSGRDRVGWAPLAGRELQFVTGTD